MTRLHNTFPWKSAGTGIIIAYLGWLFRGTVLSPAAGWMLASGAGLAAVQIGRWHGQRRTSAGMLGHWTRRNRRNDGLASRWDLFRTSSKWAMRRQAHKLLPQLEDQPRAVRRDVAQYTARLCRVGVRAVYSTIEEVTTILGGPRQGKTELAADLILDAPGAVVSTSTKPDLVGLTAGVRSRRGPVHVFNIDPTIPFASTVKFDPLAGCKFDSDCHPARGRSDRLRPDRLPARGLADSRPTGDEDPPSRRRAR
jgi:type IV secretion system protein VirD4